MLFPDRLLYLCATCGVECDDYGTDALPAYCPAHCPDHSYVYFSDQGNAESYCRRCGEADPAQ